MKKALIILSVVAVLVVGFEFFGPDLGSGSASAQDEIRQTLGEPSHFTLQYVPRGEGGTELARHETWFYPTHGRSITFYAGEIVATDEMPYEEPGATVYSSITPPDLSIDTTFEAIKTLVGNAPIEKVDFLPELFLDTEVETYMTDHLIFTLEGGLLVYAQTVGTTE